MIACLLFGDSLALGTGAAVNAHLAYPCEMRAVSGAGLKAMTHWSLPPRRYDAVILSLGSNDDISASVATARLSRAAVAMVSIRSRLRSERVIWLLPYDRARAYVVRGVATTFGDEILDLARFFSRDGVHPKHYEEVARTLLR